jgi:hypothetical protein
MTTVIEGIALTPTMDVQGTDWPEDALREAADSLKGSPVIESFGGDPDTVGEVTDSEYRDGEGVWYRAEIETDIPLDGVKMAPSVTFGSPVLDEEQERVMVKGLQFEALAPVMEATEAVGDHKIVEEE